MGNADLVEVSVRELNRLRAVEKVARDLVERSACYPDGRLRFWSPVKRLERLLDEGERDDRFDMERARRLQETLSRTHEGSVSPEEMLEQIRSRRRPSP